MSGLNLFWKRTPPEPKMTVEEFLARSQYDSAENQKETAVIHICIDCDKECTELTDKSGIGYIVCPSCRTVIKKQPKGERGGSLND